MYGHNNVLGWLIGLLHFIHQVDKVERHLIEFSPAFISIQYCVTDADFLQSSSSLSSQGLLHHFCI